MDSTTQPRPPATPPWVNRMMRALLRSPLSRLVDRGVMLLTVTGRRTGRRYTFPVQYVEVDDTLWVISGGGPEKTWWRNLVDGAPVSILLRRVAREGDAQAFTYASDPALVTDGLRRYAARFPGMARRLGIVPGDDASLARAAQQTVVVRIDLPAEAPAAGPKPSQQVARGAG